MGEGVGVGFLAVLDGAVPFIGKSAAVLGAAVGEAFVGGPPETEAISIFVFTSIDLCIRRFFDAGLAAPATILESVFVVSIAAGSSDFLFLGGLDFSFSLAVRTLGRAEPPMRPETLELLSIGLENKLLKLVPISPKRLAAISASAAARAACFLAKASRFSFFASFNFMPRFINLGSSAPVDSVMASVFRVSFPGT